MKITRRRLITAGTSLIAAPAIIRPSLSQIVQFSGAHPTSAGFDWSTVDGSPNASGGTAQFPTFFSSNGYVARPPWKVSGVDYAVGPRTGVTLRDPGANAATMISFYGSSNVSFSGGEVHLHTAGTYSGWDLVTRNFQVSAEANNITITDMLIPFFEKSASLAGDDLILKYNEFNGTNQPTFDLVSFQDANNVTFMYNYLHNADVDTFQLNGVTGLADIRFNLWGAVGSSVHPDAIQDLSSGLTINLQFNCLNAIAGNSQGWMLEPFSGDVLTGAWTNNTMRSSPDVLNFLGGLGGGGVIFPSAFNVFQNYVDYTNVVSFFREANAAPGNGTVNVFFGGGTGLGGITNNNINMVTGNTNDLNLNDT